MQVTQHLLELSLPKNWLVTGVYLVTWFINWYHDTNLAAFTRVAKVTSCITILLTSCLGTCKLNWLVVINMLINGRLRSKTVHLLLRHRKYRFMASNTIYDLRHNISMSYLRDKLYNLDEIPSHRWWKDANATDTPLSQSLFNFFVKHSSWLCSICTELLLVYGWAQHTMLPSRWLYGPEWMPVPDRCWKPGDVWDPYLSVHLAATVAWSILLTCNSIYVSAEISHWCGHVVLSWHMILRHAWTACWTFKIDSVKWSQGISFVCCKLRGRASFGTKKRVLEVLWLSIIYCERRSTSLFFGCGRI